MSGTVLLIGGTDSSGGAGLARDIATATALSAETRIAVTAVTAQNDAAVTAIHPVPPAIVAAQISAAGPVDAIKTGMLVDAATITAIAAALPPAPLVLDPVLRASSGRDLLTPDAVETLITQLLPRTTLLTPNRPELSTLADILRLGNADEAGIAQTLIARGAQAVLVKGGHDNEAMCSDRLYQRDMPALSFGSPRRPGTLRGTGCQLASAVAALLAGGYALPDAVEFARETVLRRWSSTVGIPGS